MGAFSNFKKTVVLKRPSSKPLKIDKRVLVDQDLKKKWEAAKDEKERTVALIAVNETVLYELDRVINPAPNDLVQLMEEFDCLLLTGSFLAQVERAVWSLERKYTAMQGKGVGRRAKLIEVKENLDHMKRKLELLSRTKEKERVGKV